MNDFSLSLKKYRLNKDHKLTPAEPKPSTSMDKANKTLSGFENKFIRKFGHSPASQTFYKNVNFKNNKIQNFYLKSHYNNLSITPNDSSIIHLNDYKTTSVDSIDNSRVYNSQKETINIDIPHRNFSLGSSGMLTRSTKSLYKQFKTVRISHPRKICSILKLLLYEA